MTDTIMQIFPFIAFILGIIAGYFLSQKTSGPQAVKSLELRDTIQSLAVDALRSNREEFLHMADSRLEPVKSALDRYDTILKQMDQERSKEFSEVTQQIDSLRRLNLDVSREAAKLRTALSDNRTVGRWGEVMLDRVLELAGLQEPITHKTQATEGDQRPDVIIDLARGGRIAIDAKVSVAAYVAAIEATDSQVRDEKLAEHAANISTQMRTLSRRDYREAAGSPDFVVMFVPGEAYLAAAFRENPDLFEQGAQQNVILASPLTLLALLRIIQLGWKDKRAEDNVVAIQEAGRQLYDRARVLWNHMSAIGEGLQRATQSYDAAIGSLERNYIPGARKLAQMGVGDGREITVLEERNWDPSSLKISAIKELERVSSHPPEQAEATP